MHGAGVAHLDLKPGNIILRAPKGTAESRLASVDSLGAIPVLVDFGLAGRKIRPGCGSPYYGGPEVWRPPASGATDPRAADVYAFCCLAFELLTGWTLFEADALPDLLAAHLTHDGDPPRLSLLRKDPQLATVADVLQAGLARDPRRRAAIDEVRAALATLASDLDGRPWPVAAPELVTA
jgi:serine/threonine protein kinase